MSMSKFVYRIALLAGFLLSISAAPVRSTQPPVNAKREETYAVDQAVLAGFNAVVRDIKPTAEPARPRKVLIYGVSHGPHRFVIPTAKVILEELGRATGAFTAVVSDDLANFEPEALKQFDAVCFANTTGEVFYRPIAGALFNQLAPADKETQIANADRLVKNLTEYVRAGGGFFGIHAATDTLKKSPAYGEMIGGYFDGHPWSAKQSVRVRIERPDHPLCRGVFAQEGFSITDEIYQMKAPYSRENLTVLTSVVLEDSDKPVKAATRKDGDYPLSWVKPYGKGRVFYSALGHNTSVFQNPVVLQHWLAGLQYVAGDVTVE